MGSNPTYPTKSIVWYRTTMTLSGKTPGWILWLLSCFWKLTPGLKCTRCGGVIRLEECLTDEDIDLRVRAHYRFYHGDVDKMD